MNVHNRCPACDVGGEKIQSQDGEAHVREQRHRLMPWRGRRVTTEFEGQEVTR